MEENGEIGEVVKVESEHRVVVKLLRQEACAKCKACTVGLEEKDMFLEAENACHAKLGDFVEIYLEKTSFLKAVLIMYTIPLIAFLVGILGSYFITYSEAIALIIGFVFLGITFFIIRKNDHRFNNEKYRPVAIKIAK